MKKQCTVIIFSILYMSLFHAQRAVAMFPEIIVINGMQCTGKSTLAKKLSQKLKQRDYAVKIVSQDDWFSYQIKYSARSKNHLESLAREYFGEPMHAFVQKDPLYRSCIQFLAEPGTQQKICILDVCIRTVDFYYWLVFWHAFGRPTTLYVHLMCNKVEALRRARKRGYPAPEIIQGLYYQGHYSSVYANRICDYELDSSSLKSQVLAKKVIDYCFSSSALFDAMQKNHVWYLHAPVSELAFAGASVLRDLCENKIRQAQILDFA